jgi:16S rRNA processing protein RimM
VRVGRVGRPHGLDGSFVVEHASEDETRFEVGATLWIDGEAARVVATKRAGGRPVVKLDRAARRGGELTVPASELPQPEEGSFYVFQLVGLEVADEDGRVLGRVDEVAPGVANDVLELDSGLALPMVAACVRAVDLEEGRILVTRGFGDGG